MIESGSTLTVGNMQFKVRGFLGNFVELEIDNRASTMDDYSKERVYLPLASIMQYDRVYGSTELLKYMIDPPEGEDREWKFKG